MPAAQTRLNLFTTDLLLNGFKEFPQMAQYEYTVEQLNFLQGFQENLSNNLNNPKLLNKFVDAGKQVANNLAEKYQGMWENPIKN